MGIHPMVPKHSQNEPSSDTCWRGLAHANAQISWNTETRSHHITWGQGLAEMLLGILHTSPGHRHIFINTVRF